MTTSTTLNKGRTTGNGVTTSFPYSIKIREETDIVVQTVNSTTDAVVNTLVLNDGGSLGYTVSFDTDAETLTVVTVTAPIAGEDLFVLRNLPLTQETDFPTASKFPAESIENALDKNIMIIQDQQEELNRAIKLSEASTTTNIIIPEPEANKLIAWNGSGDNLVNTVAVVSSNVITTGSTEARELADRFADILSPLDFGAIGDSSTDDTTAVQSAVTYANTNNIPLYLAKDYLISDATNITNLHDVEYIGSGSFLCDGANFYPNAPYDKETTIYFGAGGSSSNDGLSDSKPVVDINGAMAVVKSHNLLGKITLYQVAGEISTADVQEIDLPHRTVFIHGDNDVGYAFDTQVSFTSNGAGDHDLVLRFTSDITAWSVGEFMKIRAGVGTGPFAVLCGFHEITAIDTGAKEITLNIKAIQASFATTPVLTSGVFGRIPAGIQALDSMAGDNGVLEISSNTTVDVDNFYLLGSKTPTDLSLFQLGIGAKLFTRQGVAGAKCSRNIIYGLGNNTVSAIDFSGSDADSNGAYQLRGGSGEYLRACFSGVSGVAIIIDSACGASCSQVRLGGNAKNVVSANNSSITTGSGYFHASTGTSQSCLDGGIIENITGFHEYNALAFDTDFTGKITLGASETVANNTSDYGKTLNATQAGGGGVFEESSITDGNINLVGIDFDGGSDVNGASGNVFINTSSANRDTIFRALTTEKARVDMTDGSYQVQGNKVVGVQQTAVADATDAASAITQLNDLLAKLRTHGLIDT